MTPISFLMHRTATAIGNLFRCHYGEFRAHPQRMIRMKPEKPTRGARKLEQTD